MTLAPDTQWDDEEIVFTHMSPDTQFVFDRMTEATLAAVAPGPGEQILDVACGRGIDAVRLAKVGGRLFGLEPSATMARKANEWLTGPEPLVRMVRGLAESLPFADRVFDKVVCKGAIDHFVSIERTMAELARVCKPTGRIIISVANFESLSCRLARRLDGLKHRGQAPGAKRAFWEMPEDHNFRFEPRLLRRSLEAHGRIESLTGVSLLWGFPHWGQTLEKLSPASARSILSVLDRLAGAIPGWADVLVAVAVPRG
jgi:SAM-dependent methyltransferase